MDIAKAISFVFDDDRWIVKTLIGAGLMLLSFLIIPMFFIEGYLVKIVRNVMDGLEEPLPEWDNWGDLFKDGLNLIVASLVYTLPIWLLLCCSALFFIPAGATEGDISDIMAGIGVFAVAIMSCLIFLFGLALAVIAPALTIQYAKEDSLSACFQFSEVIGMARDNIGDIIIAVVVIFGLGLVLGLIGIIPIIGWIVAFLASIYVTFVSGHLFGQIGAKIDGPPAEKALDDPTIIS